MSQANTIPAAEQLLTVSDLTVSFRGLVALDSVDFEVRAGETVGVIGPNGAGKTTLMNAITGFVPPSGGLLRFEGRDVTGLRSDKLARIGIARTFQNVRLFSQLTALENVEAAAIAAGRRRAEAIALADELLALVGLDGAAKRRASEMPYGDERRLAVARAAATTPKLLLLDEPAAGLDEGETAELMTSVRMIKERLGCAVALIEHDMPMIMGICERIHVLDRGRTLAVGSPADVRGNPAVVEAYLGSADAGRA
jgi:ABC-type branched-subunit amino acid transport system ATPase component